MTLLIATADPKRFSTYEHNLILQDYLKMAEVLSQIKARFILSINNTPEMKEVFHAFKIEEVELRYSVSKEKSTVGKELLVRNF